MRQTPGRRLLLATRNPGKARELRALLDDACRRSGVPALQVNDMRDFPELPEVVEDGDDFLANARKKARQVAELTALTTLSDDSGLEVEALGGRPGVLSARYAADEVDAASGGPATGASSISQANIRKLLRELSQVPEERRGARFVCTMVLIVPGAPVVPGSPVDPTTDGSHPLDPGEYHTLGECRGRITFEPRGKGGFGYDPVFFLPELGRTMAELSPAEKNTLSHRARALEQMIPYLASLAGPRFP